MLIRNVTRDQLDRAIAAVNAQHATSIRPGRHGGYGHHGNADISPANTRGDAWRFTIRLASAADPFHRRAFRARCRCRSRAECEHRPYRTNCVCWHGHRELMRAVFAASSDPEAVTIRTGITTYKGAAHFEATHEHTHASACDCEETPRAIYGDTDFSGCFADAPMAYRDAYGQDEANGAACRAMATALASIQKERQGGPRA